MPASLSLNFLPKLHISIDIYIDIDIVKVCLTLLERTADVTPTDAH